MKKWVLILSLFPDVEGFSSIPRIGLGESPAVVRSMAPPRHTEDFEGFYQEQTAEYGVELAKEFQHEQESRILRHKRVQLSRAPAQDNIENSDSSQQTPGFFSNGLGRVTRLSSKPSRAVLQMSAPSRNLARKTHSLLEAPTSGESLSSGNGDNLLLVMSATMAATFAGGQAAPPILLSISLTVLTAGWSVMVLLGEGSCSPLWNSVSGTQLFSNTS
jgi:hypothetical protein